MRYFFEVKISSAGSSCRQFSGRVQHDRSFACRRKRYRQCAARIVQHSPSLPAELAGGGQIAIDGNYAYVGHQHRPSGTTILEISDPRKPKILSTLKPNHPWSHSHKARIVGDLMVVNSEFERGDGRLSEYPDGGFRIYDVKDRTNPKLVSFVKTHGKGVHRFDIETPTRSHPLGALRFNDYRAMGYWHIGENRRR